LGNPLVFPDKKSKKSFSVIRETVIDSHFTDLTGKKITHTNKMLISLIFQSFNRSLGDLL